MTNKEIDNNKKIERINLSHWFNYLNTLKGQNNSDKNTHIGILISSVGAIVAICLFLINISNEISITYLLFVSFILGSGLYFLLLIWDIATRPKRYMKLSRLKRKGSVLLSLILFIVMFLFYRFMTTIVFHRPLFFIFYEILIGFLFSIFFNSFVTIFSKIGTIDVIEYILNYILLKSNITSEKIKHLCKKSLLIADINDCEEYLKDILI